MTILKSIVMEEITCGGCSITFAVPQEWIAAKRREAGSFHCPNGCGRSYQESDADRLRKQLETRERELREAKCETLHQNQLREQEQIARGKAEKKLHRVKHGVCPCCKRSFQNLRRHMESKHPQAKL